MELEHGELTPFPPLLEREGAWLKEDEKPLRKIRTDKIESETIAESGYARRADAVEHFTQPAVLGKKILPAVFHCI